MEQEKLLDKFLSTKDFLAERKFNFKPGLEDQTECFWVNKEDTEAHITVGVNEGMYYTGFSIRDYTESIDHMQWVTGLTKLIVFETLELLLRELMRDNFGIMPTSMRFSYFTNGFSKMTLAFKVECIDYV